MGSRIIHPAIPPANSVDSEAIIDGEVKAVDIGDDEVLLERIEPVAAGSILGQPIGAATVSPVALTPTQSRDIVGVDQPVSVRKGTPGTVAKGTPFQITGYNPSGFVEIEEADAAAAGDMPAVSVASQDITNSATAGEPAGVHVISGIKTNYAGWAVGDDLYVANGGGLTKTKPTGTDLIQKTAEVLRVHSSQGAILVFGAGRPNDIPNVPELNIWVGDASGVPQEQSLINTDGHIWLPSFDGRNTAGVWNTFSGSNANPVKRRIPSLADGVWVVSIPMLARGTANRGRMVTAFTLVYSVTTAAVDDVRGWLRTVTVPTHGSGMPAMVAAAGSYDVDHNSSAKRGADNGAGGLQYHTSTFTLSSPAYLADLTGLFLQFQVDDAGGGTGEVDYYGAMLHYTETLLP